MRSKPHIYIPKEKIEAFCKEHDIISLSLFGSVLTDKFSETSDVDVLVEFMPNHSYGFLAIVGMEDELTEIFGRKADLRTPMELSRYFREEVIKQAYNIYG